jgi:type I restriction enzyme S subunit
MSPDWQLLTVGDLFNLVNGYAFKSSEFIEQGVPVIKIKNVKAGYFSEHEFSYVHPKNLQSRKEKIAKVNDLLISMSGNRHDGSQETWVGKVAFFNKNRDYLINQRVGALRVKDRNVCNERFASYVLSSIPYQNLFISIATSSGGQANLSPSQILNAPFLMPPIESQISIGMLLGSLDDRIALLRETNQTLEAIAQTIFKSWFVNFDPVVAKRQGLEPEGMDAETAALFPDAFEETELGAVPKGWTLEALDQNINFLNGLALQKFPPTGINDLPVIKIAQLRKGDVTGADLAANSIKPAYVVKDGDVLFSWSGSLEVEIWCGGCGALNQHLFKVSSPVYHKWFIYLWTRKYLNEFRQIAAGKATTMGHIQRSHLSAAKILVPDKRLLDTIDSIISPLIDKVIENNLQVRSLSSLRDTLLPRLISGQLRLPDDAKQIVAETV